jgi:hypothetical protein
VGAKKPLVLLDTSEDSAVAQEELGPDVVVGQLLTPLNGFRLRDGLWFAIDNGAFAGLDTNGFLSRIGKCKDHIRRCLFVCLPDVIDPCSRIGSARRTIEVFHRWRARPELQGWPVALVAQDGIGDFDLPWDDMNAIFIGGSDDFKTSAEARHVALAARALGKWVHVGRVNEKKRFSFWRDVMDSCDGSGVSRFTHMREDYVPTEPLEPLFHKGCGSCHGDPASWCADCQQELHERTAR